MRLKIHHLVILCALISTCTAFSVAWRPKYLNEAVLQNVGNDVASTSNKNGGECGESLEQLDSGRNGFIQSTNYPNKYEAGLECTWVIKAVNGTRIHVTIFDLKTYSDPVSDVGDSLYVSLTGNWNDTQR